MLKSKKKCREGERNRQNETFEAYFKFVVALKNDHINLKNSLGVQAMKTKMNSMVKLLATIKEKKYDCGSLKLCLM